ncbi:MAG: 4Fe-4S dicluster domain-containing protein [Hadesarchaea archaeon]|nr:4Fe-4S dicluster domain-containing protein [Hadesarchaea archaeon]
MSRKILYIDPLECTGCRNCEIACSYIKEGLMNPQKSRIRVVRIGATFDSPIVCRQCVNAPCAQSCPVEAIERRGRVWVVNTEKCIGCGICVQECPFGAIWLHPDNGTAIKCDQCGNCVRHCPPGKLRFIDPNDIAYERGMKHSMKLKELLEEKNEL